MQAALSLVPLAVIRGRMASGILRMYPELASCDNLERQIRTSRRIVLILLSVPLVVGAAIGLVSLERTPLTGRCVCGAPPSKVVGYSNNLSCRIRLIVLSPSEEEGVARDLQGMGWYNAVANILLAESPTGVPPKVVPSSDPRYIWAQQVLRHLESALPALQAGADAPQLAPGVPHPPPAAYPLVPRPRMAERVHQSMEETTVVGTPPSPSPHSVFGPYNLLIVERPEANAMSYGLGGNGSAGIVIYTGFFDELWREQMRKIQEAESVPQPAPPQSWWSLFFGSSLAQSPPPPPPRALEISPEQTAKLAMLLAHEMSHLILAHHVESLASLFPSALNWTLDIVRTLFFPVSECAGCPRVQLTKLAAQATIFLGPFLNDWLQTKSHEHIPVLRNLHDAEVTRLYELEADVVSARIMAYAGFDARVILDFWEKRAQSEDVHATPGSRGASADTGYFSRLLPANAFDSHPLKERRIVNMREELARWT